MNTPWLTRAKAVTAVLAAALAAPALAQWKIPDPWKAEHPGAREAPASSPATYPDEPAFKARAEAVIKALADTDLQKWREGYFAGGDPGKYLLGHAMAKLILDPKDPMALRYMNDDRAWNEHYHFAAVGWARFLPLFGAALTESTQQKYAKAASTYGSYHSGSGTENHKVMWYSSALVLPHYMKGDGMLGRMPKDALLRKMREWLRTYVKGLYAAGQGEWDSSTYLMFDLNGMLNVYDFSPDPECRLLAGAALDWYAAAYALKYADGIYCGPHQRGWGDVPCETIADQTGYLWWGSHYQPTPGQMGGWHYTMQPITSSWRPNRVLVNLARRNLPDLPFESRDSKPNYWFGQGIEPKANASQETVYVSKHFTLGVEWDRAWGQDADGHVFDQRTRLQLVAASPRGGISFTGGHPWQNNYGDRKGKYDQRCAAGAAAVCLSRIPEDDGPPFAFFSIPAGASEPVERAGWMFMRAADTFVALFGLGDKTVAGESELGDKEKKTNESEVSKGRPPKYKPFPILRFEGRRTGFVLQAADAADFPTLEAFMDAVAAKCRVDKSKWLDGNEVACQTLEGRAVAMKYVEGAERPQVEIDGRPVDYAAWPIYGGPYVRQEGGVLAVNDGREGFVIDFSGDLPVYKPWRK